MSADTCRLPRWSIFKPAGACRALEDCGRSNLIRHLHRLPASLAVQPFCSTDVITRLTHSAEGMVSRLTAQLQPSMMPDNTDGPIEALHTMSTAAASHGSPTSTAAASFTSVAPSSRKRVHRQMACGSAGCCEEQIAECAVMSRCALCTWQVRLAARHCTAVAQLQLMSTAVHLISEAAQVTQVCTGRGYQLEPQRCGSALPAAPLNWTRSAWA